MDKTISATQARTHFGEVMQETKYGPVIVERDGKPQVVVVSMKAYETLVKGASLGRWQELVREARQMVQAALGKTSLPSPDEMVHQAYKKLDAQFNRVR